jgi:nucleoside phosphorylase
MTRQIEIGVVTALPKEFAAFEAMLDDVSDVRMARDPMRYTAGRIGSNQLVLTLLPKMGLEPAATIATHLVRSFPNIRDVMMVGIAGGVPHPHKPEAHVRLGDVVVSDWAGVLQFDFGKLERRAKRTKFTLRSSDPPPSARLQQSVKILESRRIQGERPWDQLLARASHIEHSSRPDATTDVLYNPGSPDKIIQHPEDPDRIPGQPRIHYGTIGSSNMLLKDPRLRDQLRDEHGVKAIEMEGAGIATATWMGSQCGYLLVRGVCDYCDAHKSDLWQGYAAVAAAAYARAVVQSLPDLATASQPILDNRILMRHLRLTLVQNFTLSELELLCSDIGAEFSVDQITETISLDLIGGDGKEHTVLKLIEYLDRRGYLDYLIRAVRKARPNAPFFQDS